MKIKAWAIVSDNGDPFLTEDKQYMVYFTKKDAKKDNEGMDESIVPCEIIFYENKHRI